jgi:hypothetical protein
MLLEHVPRHLRIDESITRCIVGEPVNNGEAKSSGDEQNTDCDPKMAATH